MATGGLTGKGLGEGMQAKLGYLPSAGSQRLYLCRFGGRVGFGGGSLALIAYAFVIFGCLKVASKASDRFGSMIAIGGIRIIDDSFVRQYRDDNRNYAIGAAPPFLSYGGSFLVTCFLMLGVVQSVFRHRKVFDRIKFRFSIFLFWSWVHFPYQNG